MAGFNLIIENFVLGQSGSGKLSCFIPPESIQIEITDISTTGGYWSRRNSN